MMLRKQELRPPVWEQKGVPDRLVGPKSVICNECMRACAGEDRPPGCFISMTSLCISSGWKKNSENAFVLVGIPICSVVLVSSLTVTIAKIA